MFLNRNSYAFCKLGELISIRHACTASRCEHGNDAL